MIFAVLIGSGLYGLVALLFLILSVSELLESGLSSPVRLVLTIVTSGFWPITLLVTSLLLVVARRKNANLQVDDPAAMSLYQRP